MADSAYAPGLAIRNTAASDEPRHSLLVRLTHWIHTASFFALVVSGYAILIAHPRLYWGETGAIGTPSLIDLPIPFKLGESGWGRYLHFVSAWVCVLNGSLYVLSGVAGRHFRKQLMPSKRDLGWGAMARAISDHLHLRLRREDASYNPLQRLSYLAVVFVLFPVIVATGLAMSPAITSVFPWLVTVFGGQQSARTVHFVIASLLALFLLVHIAMVCVTGFTNRMRAMITGDFRKVHS